MIKEALLTSLFLIFAIIIGAMSGLYIPEVTVLSDYVDYLILALIFLVFIDVPYKQLTATLEQPKALFIAWATNFLVLPFLGYGLASVFVPNEPLVAIGLAVYFMSPCTDWFLGFTRMAGGNTGLGSVLLPINMLTQLLMYPFMMQWFSSRTVASISAQEIGSTLFNWFLVPVFMAVAVRVVAHYLPVIKTQIDESLSMLTNLVLYALVFAIFAVNIQQISDNIKVFYSVLACVLVFFTISLFLTESVAKLSRFNHENHVLYAMTTTARNAPLMLGVTMVALPNQPLLYATIIIGMLIEFPFLTLQVARFNLFANKDLHTSTDVLSHENQTNIADGTLKPSV